MRFHKTNVGSSTSHKEASASSTNAARTRQLLAASLEKFAGLEPLRERISAVLEALPVEVQIDLLEDSRFRIALDDFVPGEGRTVWMACPGPIGRGSRCVVLKPRLADCSEAFAQYVIAHELAHAYLRHAGWGDLVEPEAAADALAASWGFPKPAV